MNIISQNIINNNKIYDHLLEEFLHNLAGKINVFNLMLEMHYSRENLQQNMKLIEGLLLLYRGVLLQRPELQMNYLLLHHLFEDRGTKLTFKDVTHNFNNKAFLLCFLYNLTSNSTELIFEKNQIIITDTMDENILHIKNKIEHTIYNEDSKYANYLNKYSVINKNNIILYLDKE